VKQNLGAVTMRFKIRSDWDGRLNYVSSATMTYDNGQVAAEADVDKIEHGSHKYWGADGTTLSWEEWTQYNLDYFNKQKAPERR